MWKAIKRLIGTKSLFSRTFLSILAIAFAVLTIVVIGLFFVFRREMQRDYRELTMVSLSNTDAVFSRHVADAKSLAAEWFSSYDGTNARLNPSYNMRDNLAFINRIRDSMSGNSFMQSVYFLNQANKISVYAGSGVSFTESLEEQLPIKLEEKTIRDNPFIWTVKNRYPRQNDVTLLSLFMLEASPQLSHYTGAAIINIDAQQLGKTILSSQSANNFKMFIVSSEGTVVLHSDMKYYGEDWSDKPFVHQVLSGDLGPFEESIDGMMWEFNAIASATRGLYVISQSENANLLANRRYLIPKMFGIRIQDP